MDWDSIAHFLSTSFGPNGKTKVIKLSTGNYALTRDGSVLLQALTGTCAAIADSDQGGERSRHSTVVLQLLLALCRKRGEAKGDGSITLFLLSTHLLQRLGVPRLIANRSHTQTNYRRALELILSGISLSKQLTFELLRQHAVVVDQNNSNYFSFRTQIRWFLRSLLAPSSTSTIAAQVEDIMMDWLFIGINNSPASLESSASAAVQVLWHRSRQSVQHFDDLVVCCDASGQPSSASAVLAPSDLILDARLLDNTSTGVVEVPVKTGIASSSSSPSSAEACDTSLLSCLVDGCIHDRTLSDKATTGQTNTHQLLRAICIGDPINRYLTDPERADTDTGTGRGNGNGPVLQASGAPLSVFESIQLRTAQRVCKLMQQLKVGYVLCHELVDGQSRNVFALSGLVVVDGIPCSQLQMVCNKCGCKYWETASDVIGWAAILNEEDSLLNHQEPKDEPAFFHCEQIQRSFLSRDRKVFVRRLYKYVISSASSPSSLPSQVLVHGSNTYEVAILVKLLKKALVAVHSCFAEDYLADNCEGGRVRDKAPIFIPGGGLMEFLWSAVWRQIGHKFLTTETAWSAPSDQTDDIRKVNLFKAMSQAIAHQIYLSIYERFAGIYEGGTPICLRVRFALSDCCGFISDAYYSIFQRLCMSSASSLREQKRIWAHQTTLQIPDSYAEWLITVASLSSSRMDAARSTAAEERDVVESAEREKQPVEHFPVNNFRLFWTNFVSMLEFSLSMLRTDGTVTSVGKRAAINVIGLDSSKA